ncbi:MAG: ribosome small subunit-dependent GTPase A [Oscillospiraceae bacterium]|nr:ribosome small subunit-dependent GTPase A [Oscillospiraceae bacterium]MDY4586082.1 ribosome small subunit-dependent GTPase A [Oscillospiraceae bacterium]
MSEKVILKSIGGFYYVKSGDEVIECKAKGKFRNLSLSPVAGDIVDTEFDGSTNVITKIYPRKNKFIRPPFANLDLLVLVISTVDPAPNYLVIDKMCAIAENKDVQVIMVITKTDMAEYENIRSVYAKAGFKVFYTGADDDGQLEEIRREMQGKLCVFSGNSGVGKSTLLNKLFPHLSLETGITSKKLGRGKHTTRRVEIFETDGCMVADTPGFSSVELVDDNFISKDDLQYAFVEFAPYLGSCKFADCRHINEIGCAVKGAVDGGEIPQSRYESYKALYDRQKNIKEWEL